MDKEKIKSLWDMRNLSVEGFLSEITKSPDLKFILTSAGMWFLLRWTVVVLFGWHMFFTFIHLFHYVAG